MAAPVELATPKRAGRKWPEPVAALALRAPGRPSRLPHRHIPLACLAALVALLFALRTLSVAGILPPLPGAPDDASGATAVELRASTAGAPRVESLAAARLAALELHRRATAEPARATPRGAVRRSAAKPGGATGAATHGYDTKGARSTERNGGGTIDTSGDDSAGVLDTGSVVDDAETAVSEPASILPGADAVLPDTGSILPSTDSLEVPTLP